jgi:peptidyl-prolyl cis-trans isomerase C
MMRRVFFAALPAVLLAGCDSGAPTGQVVARVNGEEITRRDLLIELQASNLPPGVDIGRYRAQLVEVVVARKLLAQSARKEGIDTTPDYVAAIRRDREQRLVQFLDRRSGSALPPPSPAVVTRHAAARSAAYDARRVLTIDRLRVAYAGPGDRIAASDTIDAVAARLNAVGRRHVRERVELDSLNLTPARLVALDGTAAGTPLHTRHAGETILEQRIATISAPVSPTARPMVARAELARDAAGRAAAKRIARLRARARIEYQPGYAG